MGSWDVPSWARHVFMSGLLGERGRSAEKVFLRERPLAYIYSSCSAAAQRRRWTESTCLARAAAAHYFGRFSRLLFLSDEIMSSIYCASTPRTACLHRSQVAQQAYTRLYNMLPAVHWTLAFTHGGRGRRVSSFFYRQGHALSFLFTP